jgi:hypothetical protein
MKAVRPRNGQKTFLVVVFTVLHGPAVDYDDAGCVRF